MQHTLTCQRQHIERRVAQVLYDLCWPNHCRVCGGCGGFFSSFDPSPAGMTLGSGSFSDVEPCTCIEQGICPRCGQMGLAEGGAAPCAFCCWTYHQGGRPEEAECACPDPEEAWFAHENDWYP